jgi:RIO-like serine/threonine protein kinase
MAADSRRPYVDALSMGPEDVRVYEAIATLEDGSGPVTRAEIAVIAGLDEQALDRALSRLTDRRALVRTQAAAGAPSYELAHREWRAAPDSRP